MDPLSIIAGSTGIAAICVKVSISLNAFVDDYKTVDRNITDFLDEIKLLSRVAEAIRQSWQQNILDTAHIQAGDVWKSVQDTLEDCRTTLAKLAEALKDVDKGRTYLPRKFLRTIRLNAKMKDILLFKQQFHTYNSAMQSALQMINVCLLVNGNSSQDSIKRVLVSLKVQIGRIERNIRQPDGLNLQLSPAEAAENEKLARNLSQLARMASDFHSSASTAIEGDRSTVWGGSVMGEPLGTEQYARIHGWIPPVVFEDDENATQEVENLGLTPGKGPLDSDTDSNSDVEKHLLMNHFKSLGITAFESQDWYQAERYLRKAVTHEKSRPRPQAMLSIELMLACSCMLLNKWDEGEAIILPYTTGKKQHNVLLYYALYGLAAFKCHQNEWTVGLGYCQQAVRGIRKAEGQYGMSYQVSLRFLAYIHGALGNRDEEEGFLSFVREKYLDPIGEDPDLALAKIMDALSADSTEYMHLVGHANTNKRSLKPSTEPSHNTIIPAMSDNSEREATDTSFRKHHKRPVKHAGLDHSPNTGQYQNNKRSSDPPNIKNESYLPSESPSLSLERGALERRVRQDVSEPLMARRIKHQFSLQSLISSSDVDSREMEAEILRQIKEEGLLNGIDLENIDDSQEDQISERIAQAFQRRQEELSSSRGSGTREAANQSSRFGNDLKFAVPPPPRDNKRRIVQVEYSHPPIPGPVGSAYEEVSKTQESEKKMELRGPRPHNPDQISVPSFGITPRTIAPRTPEPKVVAGFLAQDVAQAIEKPSFYSRSGDPLEEEERKQKDLIKNTKRTVQVEYPYRPSRNAKSALEHPLEKQEPGNQLESGGSGTRIQSLGGTPVPPFANAPWATEPKLTTGVLEEHDKLYNIEECSVDESGQVIPSIIKGYFIDRWGQRIQNKYRPPPANKGDQ